MADGRASAGMADDQADRDKARFLLSENVLVEAGAGTGKTTLLTDRILHTLLAGGAAGEGVELERLVALTFTNKAAGEIKQRLSSLLLDLLSRERIPDEKRREETERRLLAARREFGIPEERVVEAAEKALRQLDRAMIGTIHHFASHILKLWPIEAGVDPGFEVDMGEGFRELFESEWIRWTSEELGDPSPRPERWLEVLRLATLEDLKELARALCMDMVRSGRVGTTPELALKARGLISAFGALRGLRIGGGPGRRFPAYVEALWQRLQGLDRALESPLPVPEHTPPPLPERDWPKSWGGLPGREAFERGRELAGLTSGEQESLVRKAVGLVAPFAEDFRAAYARRGLVTSDGLILRTLALVKGDKAVRRRLKESYDAILIDEFQDTDPLQGEILLFLAERKDSFADEWRSIRLQQGKLFIVGDPKQSIYRFRGADMRAYDGFKELLASQGAETCALRRSYRSDEGIVAPVNAVFSRIMVEAEGAQPAYIPILPRPREGGAAEPPVPSGKGERPPSGDGGPLPAAVQLVVVRDPAQPDAALKADACRAAEARWIARWITDHCPEPLRFKDIAVLLRTTTSLAVYLQALKEAGVPYAVEADKYFYGTQEVLDFTNLLRALDDPSDGRALAGLLRSPLVGLEDRQLYALRRRGGLDLERAPARGTLPAEARRRLAAFGRMLSRLRRWAGREPLDDFIVRVLRDTFLLELCSAAYHHEQTASNLMKYRRLAKAANDARGATLKDFIAEVERSAYDGSVKEGESPLADEHFDAVRILSIHKAKGLEYPVVMLPNLGAPQPGQGEKPSYRVDWKSGTVGLRLRDAKAADAAMAFIEIEEKARLESEGIRQLYVAMTRAKSRLILLGDAVPGPAGSFSELLGRARAWPGGAGDGGRPAAFVEPREGLRLPVAVIDSSGPEPRAYGSAPSGARAPASGQVARLARDWAARYRERDRLQAVPVFTSPTAPLREPEKAALEDEGESAAGSLARERRTFARERALLVGEACHAVLEGWDFRAGGDLRAALGRACERLRREGPPAEWEEVEAEALGILESFLAGPAARELAACELLGRELPFVYGEGGQVVRGSIDLLYRSDGRLWVADYKTGRPGPCGAARRAAYRRQGRAYAEVVRRAFGEPSGFRLLFLRDGSSRTMLEPDLTSG